MRFWAYALGGLFIWAAHFFTLYAAASLFLTSDTTRLVTLVATLAGMSTALWLAWRAWSRRGDRDDALRSWAHLLAALSGAVAAVAILWQGLPALLI